MVAPVAFLLNLQGIQQGAGSSDYRYPDQRSLASGTVTITNTLIKKPMESSDALLNGLQPIPNNHTTPGAMRQHASETASAVDQLLSPPSEVPADPEKPVILEQWKSDADQASAAACR